MLIIKPGQLGHIALKKHMINDGGKCLKTKKLTISSESTQNFNSSAQVSQLHQQAKYILSQTILLLQAIFIFYFYQQMLMVNIINFC